MFTGPAVRITMLPDSSNERSRLRRPRTVLSYLSSARPGTGRSPPDMKSHRAPDIVGYKLLLKNFISLNFICSIRVSLRKGHVPLPPVSSGNFASLVVWLRYVRSTTWVIFTEFIGDVVLELVTDITSLKIKIWHLRYISCSLTAILVRTVHFPLKVMIIMAQTMHCKIVSHPLLFVKLSGYLR